MQYYGEKTELRNKIKEIKEKHNKKSINQKSKQLLNIQENAPALSGKNQFIRQVQQKRSFHDKIEKLKF